MVEGGLSGFWYVGVGAVKLSKDSDKMMVGLEGNASVEGLADVCIIDH